MALYETTFIARQDIQEKDVKKLADNFAKIIKDDGGKIIKSEYWGLRSLAHKMNKNKKGHYMFLGVEASSAALNELNRKYRLSEDVIRHLTVKVANIDTNRPSAILRQDEDSESLNFDAQSVGGTENVGGASSSDKKKKQPKKVKDSKDAKEEKKEKKAAKDSQTDNKEEQE